MIERLLAGDGALERSELDAAERLYAQVADADPRNAIAVVGLARVANARGDVAAARELAERALTIDPDEAAAHRLLQALTHSGEPEATGVPEPTVAAAPGRERGILGFLRRLLRRR